MSFKAALFSVAIGLLACAGPERPTPRSVWVPAWGFGAFGGGELDLRDICPRGSPREVVVGSSWATVGTSLLTLGVYTPRETRVRCAPWR